MLRKLLCVVLAHTVFFVGCGGHNANPVDRYMLKDESKSCNALYAEVANIDTEIALKNRSKTDRDTWNVIFFVTGFLVIVPWFFIDSKGSQEVEMEALKARKNALQILYSDKNCGAPNNIKTSSSVNSDIPFDSNGIKVGATECSLCGKHIAASEKYCVYKLKRVCPECFDKAVK
jgi:hypothetical protein